MTTSRMRRAALLAAVIAIEQRGYPPLEVAFQIARVFGLPLDVVFQYEAPHD